MRELSMEQSWIMIKSSTELELIPSSSPFFIGLSAGEGRFGVPYDREKLAPVLQQALMRKLKFHLKAQDLVGYRVLLNLQTVHLRGFDATAAQDIVPGFEIEDALQPDKAFQSARHFLYQNGFTSVNQVDSGGWAPLHYAALRGDLMVVQGLLDQRANINRWTRKDQPMTGQPLGLTAFFISSFFRNYDVMRLLISARAEVESGLHPVMAGPAVANDPEGVRLLCEAGCHPFRKNLFGDTAVEYAAAFGAPAALEELVVQVGSRFHQANMSRSLYLAAACRGASAELIHRLLDLRADVNAVGDTTTAALRVLCTAKALQHRYGKSTLMSRWSYHRRGQTALMAAVMTGQYEGAAALIAAGARLDLRNSRNWTAADFATGHSVPQFLMDGFEGQLEGCVRIAESARRNDCVEL